eukprot:2438532-Rhodomonas_salina.1
MKIRLATGTQVGKRRDHRATLPHSHRFRRHHAGNYWCEHCYLGASVLGTQTCTRASRKSKSLSGTRRCPGTLRGSRVPDRVPVGGYLVLNTRCDRVPGYPQYDLAAARRNIPQLPTTTQGTRGMHTRVPVSDVSNSPRFFTIFTILKFERKFHHKP